MMKLLKNQWITPALLILILVTVLVNIAITLDVAEETDKNNYEVNEVQDVDDLEVEEGKENWFSKLFNFDDEDELEENEGENYLIEQKGEFETSDEVADLYNPKINPTNFVSEIDNPYYTLKSGMKYTYMSKTEEGTEKNIVVVTDKTKNILDVKTVVVWDRVWLNDELIEETYDWYAQDKEGNVWYMGEDSKEYENGKVVSTKGSWEAGVDGAKPGIIMEANPKIGDSYRQEYYKGEAEDMADVVALGESVEVSFGSFDNCLKTRDWTPLDLNLNEYKYYCSDVGGVVLETVVDSKERVELINFER